MAPCDASHQKLQPGHETAPTYSLPRTHTDGSGLSTGSHTATDSSRLQSTQAVDLQTHEAPVCSRCESAAALRRRDVCRVRARVGARVTAAQVLQCFADAADTLHSGSRSCNHTNHRRRSARGTGRHVAARAEPAKHEDQSTSRDDEDLSAPFASVVMLTSASYFTMTIIRHTRRAHSNSECTVRQVHGATHCHEGHAASQRLGCGLIHRTLACWCSVARCSPRCGRHLHESVSITIHMEHDNMCEPMALKTTHSEH